MARTQIKKVRSPRFTLTLEMYEMTKGFSRRARAYFFLAVIEFVFFGIEPDDVPKRVQDLLFGWRWELERLRRASKAEEWFACEGEHSGGPYVDKED